MQLPRLELHKTFAKLGIEKRNATLQIRQPQADLTYNQPQPEVKMHKTEGKLTIDQTEAFADAGLKHPFRMTKEQFFKSKQKVLQSLAAKAAEGDQLMKIENQSSSVIPQIAKNKSESPQKEFNIGFVPSSMSKVKIHYQPSEIKMSVNLENFKLRVKPNKPIIKFNEGDLQIYLKQKANLRIQAVGAAIDQVF